MSKKKTKAAQSDIETGTPAAEPAKIKRPRKPFLDRAKAAFIKAFGFAKTVDTFGDQTDAADAISTLIDKVKALADGGFVPPAAQAKPRSSSVIAEGSRVRLTQKALAKYGDTMTDEEKNSLEVEFYDVLGKAYAVISQGRRFVLKSRSLELKPDTDSTDDI